MRRLALHASALSDAEYDLFTANLRDIADGDKLPGASTDDAYYEKMTVGVREARAWLRGRYAHVQVSVIDSILKLFSPNLAHGDAMTGAEFFAALRLVLHAESGKEVDRSLAFVQVDPATRTSSPTRRVASESRSTPSSSRPSSPRKRAAELPPRMPLRRQTYRDNSIAASSKSSAAESTSNNPFSTSPDAQNQTFHPQPPLHPSQRSESSKSIHSTSHNPFLPGPPRSEDGTSTKLPPLPPRKPPPPTPPPRHVATTHRFERSLSPSKAPSSYLPAGQAIVASASSSTIHTTTSSPPVPPKPSHHITSTLMKQSLQASKVGQSLKKAEEQLEKERVMQVLKSSSVVSGSYSLAGASVTGSSIVVGTNIHNQHQHQYPAPRHQQQPQRASSPSKKYQQLTSASNQSLSSGSDGGSSAPPLPRRRTATAGSQNSNVPSQQPSPPLSASSLEQVALAAPPLPPPFAAASASPAYARSASTYDSPFRSPVNSQFSPQQSPTRAHQDLPTGPPPRHPDRKPQLGGYHAPSSFGSPSHSQSQSQSYSESQRANNLETFESIYGSISSPSPMTSPSISASSSDPNAFSTPSKMEVTSSNPDSPTARVFRSKSLHHASPPAPPLPPPVRRKRPESVQVLGNGEILLGGPGLARAGTVSGASHLRRSSLSVTSTPSSNRTALSHEAAASTTSGGGAGPGVGAGVSSNIQRTIDVLHNIHGQLQPKLEKARYKAEAGLSRRGYVRGSGSSVDGIGGGGHRRLRGSEEETEREGLTGGHGHRERWKEGGSGHSPDVEYGSDDGLGPDGAYDDEWRRGTGMAGPPEYDSSGIGKTGPAHNVFESPYDFSSTSKKAAESRESLESLDSLELANAFPLRGPGSVVGVEKDNLKWPTGDGWKQL